MPRPRGHREIEIKLRLANIEEGRRRLRRAGFRILARRTRESNIIFDTAGGALKRAGALLRLRRSGRRSILTYKGPAVPSARHKSREELEVAVSDPETAQAILERLGFAPVFRYEKYRSEYAQPGQPGLVTLDETPIGTYLEIEASPDRIDRIARRLGFRETDYITASYGTLYLADCKAKQIKPGDMLFARAP